MLVLLGDECPSGLMSAGVEYLDVVVPIPDNIATRSNQILKCSQLKL